MNKTHAIFVVGGLALASGVVGTLIQAASAPLRAKEIEKSFAPFNPSVKTRSDDSFFYVESDGMPDHEMMVGIVAWQQQVPLPQPYTGANAWRFPLIPTPAEQPLSAKDGFFRGAIAIAANGVPIFNPIKNDGRTDTLLAGELDKFGGHGGRADDYHYHTAPTHLNTVLGPELPIAYALDGYPIYGFVCKDGRKPTDLDSLNGHTTSTWGYHYHATQAYPYLNGGFHGVVTERGGQVDPQPAARGVRPSLPPLRGAKIIGFQKRSNNAYQLRYEIRGETHTINYAIQPNGEYLFEFVAPDGAKRTETYRPSTNQRRGDGAGGGRGGAPKAPDAGTPRRPWILEHAPEIDTNKDKLATLIELNELINAAWKEVAGTSKSMTIDQLKAARPARNVVGGYLKGHAAEFDADADGTVTLQEILDEFASLLHKADKNHDHALSPEEYGA